MILHIHLQNITPAEQAEHISGVEQWLNAIELGMTPSGVVWSYATVQTRFAKAQNKTVDLPTNATDVLDRLRHVRAELKSYQELEDMLKAELCQMIGEADTAVLDGRTVATWKPQTRDNFDTKAFRAAHPELAAQFTKQVQTRTLLLKGDK